MGDNQKTKKWKCSYCGHLQDWEKNICEVCQHDLSMGFGEIVFFDEQTDEKNDNSENNQNDDFTKTNKNIKKSPLILAVAVVLIAAIFALPIFKDKLLVKNPSVENPTKEQTNPTEEIVIDFPEGNVFRWNTGNLETLKKAMFEPKIEAIRQVSDANITQDITINKPLLIEKGCSLDVNGKLIIDGVSLYVEGEVHNNNMIQVQNGGRIVVAENAVLEGVGLLWMENQDNLQAQQGASVSYQQENENRVLILNEADLRTGENVLHVTDLASWHNALDISWSAWDQGRYDAIKTIIIEQDITVTHFDYRAVFAVNVIVEPGVTIRMEGDTEDIFYIGDRASLLNYGNIEASVQSGEESEFFGDYIINKGSIRDFCFDEGTDFIINFGKINNLDNPQFKSHILFNWGDIYSATEFVDFICEVRNYGNFVVSSAGEGSHICLANGNWFWNYGMLNIKDNIHIHNAGTIVNFGDVLIESQKWLRNDGIFENYSNLTINMPQEIVEWNGILLNSPDANLDIPENIKVMVHPDTPHTVEVSSPDELKTALENEEIQAVSILTSTIAEDLVLTKPSYLSGNEILKFNSDLNISGENAYLYIDGAIDMKGHKINLEDGAVLFVGGGLENCSEINIRENSRMILLNGTEINMQNRNKILLEENAAIIVCGGKMISNADFEIQGWLNCMSDFEISDSYILVGQNGCLMSDGCNFSIDEKSEILIEENGQISAGAWQWQNIQIDGSITNYGVLDLTRDSYNLLSADVENYGVMIAPYEFEKTDEGGIYVWSAKVGGTVNNYGEMRGNFEIIDGGTINGNKIVNNYYEIMLNPSSFEKIPDFAEYADGYAELDTNLFYKNVNIYQYLISDMFEMKKLSAEYAEIIENGHYFKFVNEYSYLDDDGFETKYKTYLYTGSANVSGFSVSNENLQTETVNLIIKEETKNYVSHLTLYLGVGIVMEPTELRTNLLAEKFKGIG